MSLNFNVRFSSLGYDFVEDREVETKPKDGVEVGVAVNTIEVEVQF